MAESNWPFYDGPPEQGRPYLKVLPHQLTIGARFATEAETGCAVPGPVEDNGNFMALDSDGVECSFNILMVVRIED